MRRAGPAETTYTAAAVTLGEPAGLGAELALLAWAGRDRLAAPPFFLTDDPVRIGRLGMTAPLAVPDETGRAAESLPEAG